MIRTVAERNQLALTHYRLAAAAVRHFRKRAGHAALRAIGDWEDAVIVATMGLLKAAERWDRRAAFSSYGFRWALGCLYKAALQCDLIRWPQKTTWAMRASIPTRARCRETVSALCNVCDTGEPVWQSLVEEEMQRLVRARVAALPDRQRQALCRTIVDGRSLQDVAEELGCCKTRVGQLRATAIAFCRRDPLLQTLVPARAGPPDRLFYERDVCFNGHPFTPENTGTRAGRPYCRTCGAAASRRCRARKKQGQSVPAAAVE